MRLTNALVVLLPVAVHAALPLSRQHPLIARAGQPYSWNISPLTFDNKSSFSVILRTSPDWLTFDNATGTFRGTPAPEDVGVTTVRLRNQLGQSDHFQLCVSDLPSPIVNIPLTSQLVPGNPSISSGFTFSAPNAGVRVPPKWSFSIGFDGFTFTTPDERNVYYDATLADGLPLPGWVVFDNRSLTFDGVAPPENRNPKLSIVLHGSDRWGFGAIHEQFDLVIGPRTHLLGVDGTKGLETVNVTGGTPFTHSIRTFGGLFIDGVPVVAANISRVDVNTSAVPWVKFDSSARILSGLPPMSAIDQPDFVLPVSITSDYNDTVDTNITLAVFPSYFASAPVAPMVVTPGVFMAFSLREYISRTHSTLATIVPEYTPRVASSWLAYSHSNDTLSGFVPRSTSYGEVNVTFYATEMETHAVSTMSLLLSIASNGVPAPEVWGHKHGADVSQRARTAIIVTFSVLGGAILLCCLLAICRHYCGVREPRDDDENSSQWKGRDPVAVQHVGSSEQMVRSIGLSRSSDATGATSESGHKFPVSVLIRPHSTDSDADCKPATMKKVHFFQRLMTPSKRKLGDQSLGSQSGKIRISQISRPTPIDHDENTLGPHMLLSEGESPLDASKKPGQHSAANSGVSNSVRSFGWPKPATTTWGEHSPCENSTQVTTDRSSQVPSESDESSLTSVPRRRSDFLPPRDERIEAFERPRVYALPPSGSSGTISMELREAAVIATAARQILPAVVSTTSVDRSVARSSVDSSSSTTPSKPLSSPSSPGSVNITGVRRPRLVQLNSERQVSPIPTAGASTVRNVSQKAVVANSTRTSGESGEIDQDQRLSLGIRYVPTLGDGTDTESAVFYLTPSVGNPSPLVGASKSPALAGRSLSVKNLNQDNRVKAPAPTQKATCQTRIPIGAPFAISVPFYTIPARGAELTVRQQDGKPAPAWIDLDQRDVEIWGVPLKEHRGTHMLDIIETTQQGQRVVAKMTLEVVEWE